jgi:hypothetical protein
MSSSDDSADDSSVSSTSSTETKKVAWRKRGASKSPAVVKPSSATKAKLIKKIEEEYGGLAGLKSDKRALKRICDKDPIAFGGRGTAERRGVQKQVHDWNRYSSTFKADNLESRAPIDESEQEDLEINMSRQLKLSRKSKVAKKASYSDSDSEDSISPTSKCAATVDITCL